jgi:hypothetical protein
MSKTLRNKNSMKNCKDFIFKSISPRSMGHFWGLGYDQELRENVLLPEAAKVLLCR